MVLFRCENILRTVRSFQYYIWSSDIVALIVVINVTVTLLFSVLQISKVRAESQKSQRVQQRLFNEKLLQSLVSFTTLFWKSESLFLLTKCEFLLMKLYTKEDLLMYRFAQLKMIKVTRHWR